MKTVKEYFQDEGIDGVYQFISDRIDKEYDSNYASNEQIEKNIEWLTELQEFLDENYSAFYSHPETIVNALYHSSLIRYPEINAWFEELKRENKVVELSWDLPKRVKTHFVERGHSDLIQGLVHLDDNRFATSSEDGYMRVWTYSSADSDDFELEMVNEIEAHCCLPVNHIIYLREKNLIASCGDDNYIRLWNSETLEMIAEFSGHSDYVSHLEFQGDYLFSASKDKRIGVWNVGTFQNITFLEGHTDWIIRMAISPDKKHLISVSTNKQMIEWDIEQFTIIHEIYSGEKNIYLDIPGENLYITQKNENSIGHSSYPKCMKWVSDAKLYTSCNEIIVWDCEEWNDIRTFANDSNQINCFLLKEAYLINFSKQIKIYNLDTGELIKEYQNEDSREIRNAVFSDDEQFLICCDGKGYISIWDWNELLYGEYSFGLGDSIFSFETFSEGDGEDSLGIAVGGGFVSEAGAWNLKDGKLIEKFNFLTKNIYDEIRIAKLHNYDEKVLIMYKQKVYMLSPFNSLEKREIELPNELFRPEIALGTKCGVVFGSQCYQPYYVNLDNNNIYVFDKKFSYTNDFSISPNKKYALALTYPQSFDSDGNPFKNPWIPISSPLALIDLDKEKRIGVLWNSWLLSWIKIHKKWKEKFEKLFTNTYPSAAGWSSDSKYFAAGFNNGDITIWNAETKKRLRKIKLTDREYVSYLTWQGNDTITVMINKTAQVMQISSASGRILKSKVIEGRDVTYKTSCKQGRYIIWTSEENILGFFDVLKFENILVLATKTKACSVSIEKNKLIIGGENGYLYGYNLEGII